jgi:hypothetical protein
VIRRGRFIVAACGFLLVLALGVLAAPSNVHAQASCRAACWESYGACYKATNSRQRCQAQLQRCLNGCIRTKRR